MLRRAALALALSTFASAAWAGPTWVELDEGRTPPVEETSFAAFERSPLPRIHIDDRSDARPSAPSPESAPDGKEPPAPPTSAVLIAALGLAALLATRRYVTTVL